jgi:hypothetical protein
VLIISVLQKCRRCNSYRNRAEYYPPTVFGPPELHAFSSRSLGKSSVCSVLARDGLVEIIWRVGIRSTIVLLSLNPRAREVMVEQPRRKAIRQNRFHG